MKGKTKKRVDSLLSAWQERLLDTSKRNVLLNIRPSKTKVFELEPAQIATIDTFMVEREKSLLLLWRENRPVVETTVPLLYVHIDPQSYRSALRGLVRSTQKVYEETGLHVLYLTSHTLEFSEKGGEAYQAPLFMIPVKISPYHFPIDLKYTEEDIRTSHKPPRSVFQVRMAEDEILVNPVLMYYLRLNWDLELPEYSPEQTMEDYITELGQRVQQYSSIELRDSCFVGLFSYHKYILFQDIAKYKNLFHENPFFQLLAGEEVNLNKGVPEVTEENIDTLEQTADMYQILPADATQRVAVRAASLGASFVLQGPPGTGKSQTISNIIAEAIATNKTVLFVSEKKAALDVVFSRLSARGLGPLLLDLHNPKLLKKSNFYKQLAGGVRGTLKQLHLNDVRKHDQLRELLNELAELMHEPLYPLTYSMYKMVGEFSKFPDIPLIDYSPDLTQLSEEVYLQNIELMDELSLFARYIDNYDKSVWKSFTSSIVSPEARQSIDSLGKQLNAGKESLEIVQNYFASLFGLPINFRPQLVSFLEKFEVVINLFSSDLGLPTEQVLKRLLVGNEVEDFLATTFDPSYNYVEELQTYIELVEYFNERYDQEVLSLPLDTFEQLLSTKFRHRRGRFFNRRKYRSVRKAVERSYKLRKYEKITYETLLEDVRKIAKFGHAKKRLQPVIDNYNHFLTLEPNLKIISQREGLSAMTKVSLILVEVRNAVVEVLTSLERRKEKTDLQYIASIVKKGLKGLIDDYYQPTQPLVDINDHLHFLNSYFNETYDLALRYFTPLAVKLHLVDNYLNFLTLLRGTVEDSEHYLILGELLKKVEGTDLAIFVSSFLKSKVDRSLVSQSYQKQVLYHTILTHFENNPKFKQTGDKRDQYVEEFSHLDSLVVKEAPRKIFNERGEAHRSIQKSWLSQPAGEESFVLQEAEKKKRHSSIRTAFRRAPKLISKLKPVIFMSPLSISYFIDPEIFKFDIAIFDEASQVRPEEALGAMIRCNQLIIVGDSRQMPPTTFFSAVTDNYDLGLDDEYEEEQTTGSGESFNIQYNAESVLQACINSSFPSMMLLYHYRSKHESLIAFSNISFYNNQLLTFPSPLKGTKSTQGLELVVVPDGVYDRGNTRTNRREAEVVVGLLEKQLNNQPSKSVGLVAFSQAQEQMIERIISERPILAKKIENISNQSSEAIFIKNLETIQGDERDVILVSLGYGKDGAGRFTQNFGPVTQSGGERRFNVLVTRAREKLFFVCSVDPLEWPESTNENFNIVKRYLLFAQSHNRKYLASSTAFQFEDPVTPFEESLKRMVQEKWYKVDTHVGFSDYKIDLAVLHPEEDRYCLAIECDGPNYVLSKTARDREKLRAAVLKNLGWNIHKIWTTNWFFNPEKEKRLLFEALEASVLETADEGGEEHLVEEEEEYFVSPDLDGSAEVESTAMSVSSVSYPFHPMNRVTVETAPSGLQMTKKYSESNPKNQQIKETLTKQIKAIIEGESPIHEEILFRRILEGWEQSRLTKKTRETLVGHVTSWGYPLENGFYWLDKNQLRHWRHLPVREPDNYIGKDLQLIPTQEIAIMMLNIFKQAGKLSQEELYEIVAKFYNRTNYERFEGHFGRAFDLAKGTGELVFHEDYWQLKD